MKKIQKSIKGNGFDRLQYCVDSKTPNFIIQWFDNWLDRHYAGLLDSTQFIDLGFCQLKIVLENDFACLQAPDLTSFPLRWNKDLYPVLQIVTKHRYIPQSYNLDMEITSMHETVIISQQFDQLPVFLSRAEKDCDTNHSGWFVTSLSDSGDYADEEELKIISLHEAVVKAPRLIDYLSMPEGTQIVFETSTPIIMFNNKVLKSANQSFLKKNLPGSLRNKRSVAL